jgi:hypothetical protein
VSGLAAPELALVVPPFDDTHVAVNDETAAPLFAPAVNDTASEPAADGSTVTPVGAAGAPTTTAADAADAALLPIALFAFTEHAYDLPVVAPVTVIGLALAVATRATPPFDDVHVAV